MSDDDDVELEPRRPRSVTYDEDFSTRRRQSKRPYGVVRDTSEAAPHDEFDDITDNDMRRRRKGPPKDMKRVCRDTPCLLLFIANWGVLAWIAYFAFTIGDIDRLTHPVDSKGWICGVDNKANDGPDNTDKTNLVIFDIAKCTPLGDCFSPSVCVSECPTTSEIVLERYNLATDQIKPNDGVPCVVGTDYNRLARDNVFDFDCAAYTLDSTAVAGRCLPIPSQVVDFADEATSPYADNTFPDNKIDATTIDAYDVLLLGFLVAQRAVFSVAENIAASWLIILVASGIGVVLVFVWLLLLRVAAPCIVYTTFVVALALFGFIGGYSWFEYDRFIQGVHPGYELAFSVSEYVPDQFSIDGSSSFFDLSTQKYLCLAVAIIFSILAILSLCLFVFLRKNVKTGLAVIKETSRAASHVWGVFVYPVFPAITIGLTIAAFIATAIFVYTAVSPNYYIRVPGTINYEECPDDTCDGSTPGVLVVLEETEVKHVYLYSYLIFGALWIYNFTIDMATVTIAGSFATYYWSPKGEMYRLPTLRSSNRAFMYHMGSVAFGSLILTLVEWVRVMLNLVEAQLTKDRTGISKNIAKFALKCLKCCLWCVEKIIKFINHNAYIEMSVYGFGFCKSARRAFWLLFRNILSVATLTGMTSFILFLGKMIISTGCATGAYFYVIASMEIRAEKIKATLDPYNQTSEVVPPELEEFFVAGDVDQWWVPVGLIFIMTWMMTSFFFAIYRTGASTIFLCYCEDTERHDGTPESPYYARAELLELVDTAKKRKQRKHAEQAEAHEAKAQKLRGK